ncbi:neuropilin 1b isoform X2 [Trichomycterus rosablanca]|uniref:neuropilin 1b isoform X2 n=1 Tax=Trichomycterus rosablanca TaxID=2290929 RepID=UPI002F353E1B
MYALLWLIGVVFSAVADLAQIDSSCGSNITITSAGYVTSPGYPSAYPLSQQCTWLIRAPDPSQRILINFNPHFDLETRECKYDFVEVYDGDSEKAPMVGKYCGKIAPSPITSSGNSLLIRFTSDYETNGAGFSVRYEVHRGECSRNVTAPKGTIQTPGFPNKYPHNLECTFIIFAPKMAEIVLEFESFDMEPDSMPAHEATCRFDHVEIWDGYPTVGPHIGRYCGSRSPGQVVAHTGILSLTIHTDSAIAREGFLANYSVRYNPDPIRKQGDECLTPLGMESGEISDERITASSQYNPSWAPYRSRLNYPNNGWTPSEDSAREWIQVDLGFLWYVSAIGTQGAISIETKKAYYVKSYKVSISTNGEDWIMIKDGTKHKVFTGNHNPTDEVRAFLSKPTLTRYVRVKPLTWEQGICMRFELYGCKISDSSCSSMLGMVSGQISDSQISVWPEVERGWLPESARLLTGRNGWIVPTPQGSGHSPWLGLDLGFPRWVTAIILQGGRLKDKNMFIRKFKLAYSSGLEWSYLLEKNSNKSKVFLGNQNHDTPEVRTFEPLMTRFLSVYPERGSADGMALRLELLGCDPQQTTSLPPSTSEVNTVREADMPLTTSAPVGIVTATEDCDDESATCHSGTGTGEDYEPTVGAVAEPSLNEDLVPAYLWFDCSFGWADQPSYCGWTPESIGQADWLLQSHEKNAEHQLPGRDYTGEPGNFIYTSLSRDRPHPETAEKLEIEIDRATDTVVETETTTDEARPDSDTEGGLARLVSVPVTSPEEDLCVSFWYRFTGGHTGALHIRQRREAEVKVMERLMVQDGEQEERGEEEVLVWKKDWQETKHWKVGRVLMLRANKPYQVIIEGVVDSTSSGHICLDNVRIAPELNATECKDPEDEMIDSAYPAHPETGAAKPEIECEDQEESEGSVWRFGQEGGAMLKTLDPILITIIVMSAVGVLLGAVCGVVLYCSCSHNPERNLSALENYNFELVDGVKLKKEKVTAQKSYTEA